MNKAGGSNQLNTGLKKAMVLLLCVVMAVGVIGNPIEVCAATTKTLTIAQAKSWGLAKSSEYTGTYNKLALAKVQYAQSIKKLKLKQKNQSTLKWSPLLSFKFPEKPDLTDAYEYTYQPMYLQTQIDVLDHKLKNVKYNVYESVSLEFCKIYELQEKISFTKKQVEATEEGLAKNKAKLMLGEATQADIDAQQKRLDNLNNSLATDMTQISTEKKKLSDLIGVNVTSGYIFASPFVDVEITEAMLDEIKNYTVEHDHNYYNTRVETNNGLLSLNTNYDLMKNQYGGKMGLIDPFVNQAKNGQNIDSAAFKLKYDQFLLDIDERWRGYKRILFIKFPKDFLKGKIDGVNYVEDEPYALYEAALDYKSLLSDDASAKKELIASVDDTYRNYISARKAVTKSKQDCESLKKDLEEYKMLNAMGKMTFDEYSASVLEYEEEQITLLSNQSAYSQILYSFDRLTCGSVSALLDGTDTALDVAQAGESYIVEDEGEGVYYYIRSLVSGNVFELGVTVSEDFEGSVDSYELWVDGTQVGSRTEIGKTIRHMAFDLSNTGKVFIRLYDGGDFVDDCIIDPEQYSGKLAVTLGYSIEKDEATKVADYSVSLSDVTGMMSIHFSPKAGEMIASYNIQTEDGKYLIDSNKIPINNDFKYLGLATADLDNLVVIFYDAEGTKLYECRFKTNDGTIQKKE